MQTANNRSKTSNKALFKLCIAFSNWFPNTRVSISKHACHAVLYRGIKVHPCDLNAGTQLVYHLMNYLKWVWEVMFPNSLIIHKEKTKKITPWARFGYRILITIKFCGTLSLNFFKNDCSFEELYPKFHSVFHPISRYPEVGLKKLGCVSFFNQLLVVWISDETLRVVLDIILLKKYRKIPKISPSVYKPLQI